MSVCKGSHFESGNSDGRSSHILWEKIPHSMVGFTTPRQSAFFMSRSKFHELFASELTCSEFKIVIYLLEMCAEWGFTTETEKSIAKFMKTDRSTFHKRISRLKSLDIVKKIDYNGRCGYMVNPIYCYQGPLHLRRFRVKLWNEERIYPSSRPDRFYGPPFKNREEAQDS